MSVIGTGIAAGVANTTQQARQAVQQRSAEQARQSDSEKNTDKVKLSQLHGAAETRDADQDLPDQPPPGYEDLYGQGDAEPLNDASQPDADPSAEDVVDLIHRADAPACSPTGLPLKAGYGPLQPNADDPTLFNHVDVKGWHQRSVSHHQHMLIPRTAGCSRSCRACCSQ